jgi:hypothetical protein
MLEEKAQDLMVDMRGLLPLIVNNALNVLGAVVILLIGLWLSSKPTCSWSRCSAERRISTRC